MIELNHYRATALIILVFVLLNSYVYPEAPLQRAKRQLVYSKGSKIKVIAGVGIPVDLDVETVVFGIVLKGIYNVPDNATMYTNPSITYARRKRSGSRWELYELLSKISESYGYGGKVCVLRAICEIADIPVDNTHGLFEELFHTMLTPTTTKEELRDHSDNEYYAAHQIGHEMGDLCAHLFAECKVSLVDMFTRLHVKL